MLFTNLGDYKTEVGQGGVTLRMDRMFAWSKHETGLISSTTVFVKDKKTERKKSLKMRGGKSDPLTVEDWSQKKRGTGNYKSRFESHGVVLQRQRPCLENLETFCRDHRRSNENLYISSRNSQSEQRVH